MKPLLLIVALFSCMGFKLHTQQINREQNEYFILGTLNDDMGRRLDPQFKDEIDRYYANEEPLFNALDSIIKVTYSGIPYIAEFRLDKKEWSGGGSIFSAELAQKFNHYYNFRPAKTATLQREPVLYGTLTDTIFKNTEQKLAFLAGAFTRFGGATDTAYTISMANSVSKAKLCYELLKEFGCNPSYFVSKNTTSVNVRVYFHPTLRVNKSLEPYFPVLKQIAQNAQIIMAHKTHARRRKASVKS